MLTRCGCRAMNPVTKQGAAGGTLVGGLRAEATRKALAPSRWLWHAEVIWEHVHRRQDEHAPFTSEDGRQGVHPAMSLPKLAYVVWAAPAHYFPNHPECPERVVAIGSALHRIRLHEQVSGRWLAPQLLLTASHHTFCTRRDHSRMPCGWKSYLRSCRRACWRRCTRRSMWTSCMRRRRQQRGPPPCETPTTRVSCLRPLPPCIWRFHPAARVSPTSVASPYAPC